MLGTRASRSCCLSAGLCLVDSAQRSCWEVLPTDPRDPEVEPRSPSLRADVSLDVVVVGGLFIKTGPECSERLPCVGSVAESAGS